MKPKIVTTNSSMIVHDYDLGDCPSLESSFQMWDPIAHKNTSTGMYYDEKNRKLYLPRGIDLSFVIKKIETSSKFAESDDEEVTVFPERCHPYAKTRLTRLKYGPRDERQVEALKFMLCEDKYHGNIHKSQFSVNLPTGAGKTYCATACISYLGIRAVIITSQSGILDQWKKNIIEYTDINSNDICKLEGSPSIDRIMSGNSRNMDKKVYLITHSTLKSYSSSHGWESVGRLFERLKIGIKIYDEAHQWFTNMSMIDFFTNVWRTYYLTATPERSDKREAQIYSLYVKNIPSINLFDEDNDPHTKYIAIRFNSNPRPIDISNCKNAYGLNRVAYIDYLMGNEYFWMAFDYLFNLIEKSGGRALFYIGTNAAILRVRDRIVRHYPEFVNDIGIYTSIAEDKVLERTKRFILSTTKSAGAGEDIKGLKFTVVLAEPFKSSVLTKQTLGRTRDDHTYYVELVDMGFRQTANYYAAKKPIFTKYALSCKQMDIPRHQIKEIAQDAYEDRIYRNRRVLEFNIPEKIEAITFKEPGLTDAISFMEGNETNGSRE